MRKIEITNITGSQKAPFLKETFNQYTQNYLDISSAVIKGMLDTYTTNDVVILWGCVVTANIPGTSEVTAGAIYYNGEIYQVDANASISSPSNTLVWNTVTTYASGDPVDWSDGTPRNLHSIVKFVLSNAGTGTGIADYNGATVKMLIKRKRLLIGNWNMSTDTDKSVAHGISAAKWKTIDVIGITIIRDDEVQTSTLGVKNTTVGAGTGDGIGRITSTNVDLTRLTGGPFDSSDYNATSFNRGFVDIIYGDI